jgi:plastocyanin
MWAAAAVWVSACGGGDTPPRDADRPAAAPHPAGSPDSTSGAYVAIEVLDGGAIGGTVRFGGVVPQGRRVAIAEDSATCGSSRLVQTVRVGPHGGLADAVVSLTDITRGVAPRPTAATLDQRGCDFTPRVLLTPVGDTVRVLNSDPLTHNVHTVAFDNRSVNRTQPTGLDAIDLVFDAPEKVRIKCDLHPWMSAWIVVTDHPYHAVTDETGAFTISHIPPGDYTVEVWHETLGTSRRTVTIVAGERHELTHDIAAGD